VFQAGIYSETSELFQKNLLKFCSNKFKSESNVSLLSEMLARHKESDVLSLENRVKKLQNYIDRTLPHLLPTEIRQFLFKQ
jgi:hypothetical protein